jgi:hypothetical protein
MSWAEFLSVNEIWSWYSMILLVTLPSSYTSPMLVAGVAVLTNFDKAYEIWSGLGFDYLMRPRIQKGVTNQICCEFTVRVYRCSQLSRPWMWC